MGICGSLMDIYDYPQARSANIKVYDPIDFHDYEKLPPTFNKQAGVVF